MLGNTMLPDQPLTCKAFRILLIALTKLLGSLCGPGMSTAPRDAFRPDALTTTRDGQDNPSMHKSLSKRILCAIACMDIPCRCRSGTNF